MKRFIATVLILTGLSICAKAQDHVTTFTADSKIARPITIKSSNGTYTLYDEVRTVHLNWFEAYDAHGDKIMIPSAKRTYKYSSSSGSFASSHYHFTTLYPKSSSSRNAASGSNSYRGSSSSHSYSRPEEPSYVGNYNNLPHYSNVVEYALWKMSKSVEKPLTNQQHYCGKWAHKFTIENVNPNLWQLEFYMEDDVLAITFPKENEYKFLTRENVNNWLFITESYFDKTPELRKKGLSHYYDDCDSNADPGFPRSGTYKYDEVYITDFYRLTLSDGKVYFYAVEGHAEYYYQGRHTYAETYSHEDYGVKPLPLVRFIPYTEKVENAGGHEAVDLGLSVLWATCNIGASNEVSYGDYFSWGGTLPQNEYWWTNAKYWIDGIYVSDFSTIKFSKYVASDYFGKPDGRLKLEALDDAAHVNWGGDWRMPTVDEAAELTEKCEWTYEERENVKGYSVKGPNGNQIFLPLGGQKTGSRQTGVKVSGIGHFGSFWTSSLAPGDSSCAFILDVVEEEELRSYIYNDRYYGFNIRPVRPK